MPSNRKRVKRDHPGGLPAWFVAYLGNGRPPAKNTPDFEEWSIFLLFGGAEIHGVTYGDTETAAKRKKVRKRLDL